MRNIIVILPFRKFFLSVFIAVTFILSISIILVGVGNSNVKKDGTSGFNLKSDNIINDSSLGEEPSISVYLSKEDKKENIALEDYVRGVIAGEMPAAFDIEALKAQAVAARTFAIAHMEEFGGTKSTKANGANVSDTVDCQVYMNKEDRFKLWPEKSAEEYWNKLTEVVQMTQGEVLTYNNSLVLEPYYFSVSTGRTDSALDVFNSDEPYLQSVKSEGEEASPEYKNVKKVSVKTFVDTINGCYPKAKITYGNVKNNVEIVNGRTDGGTVNKIRIGNVTISGTQFRSLFDLKSADFTIAFTEDNNVNISTLGYGHNVGMSQWGANVMAKAGKNYTQILTYYYKGVKIKKISDLKRS